MVDSVQLRNRRAYHHKQGDHSLCTKRCTARQAAQETGAELLGAVEVEFAACDPLVAALARRLAELATAGTGMTAVQATKALGELAAAQRDTGPPGGFDDEYLGPA